jgi:predicted pyridoxine 5'-phosphate oxidase superfamily flavin-nucleotide-binding protein
MDQETEDPPLSTDVAFSASVKEVQRRRGSRAAMQRMGFSTRLTPALMDYVSERDSAYLGTANAAGQPYIQHRGGPPGFIRQVAENTLGFADYRGNRHCITTGNLIENPRAFLFLMDYANRHRVKIWGSARVVENDSDLVASLMPPDYPALPQQAILFEMAAWDSNCPSHIPRKIDLGVVNARVKSLQDQIDELRKRNHELASEIDRLRREDRPGAAAR